MGRAKLLEQFVFVWYYGISCAYLLFESPLKSAHIASRMSAPYAPKKSIKMGLRDLKLSSMEQISVTKIQGRTNTRQYASQLSPERVLGSALNLGWHFLTICCSDFPAVAASGLVLSLLQGLELLYPAECLFLGWFHRIGQPASVGDGVGSGIISWWPFPTYSQTWCGTDTRLEALRWFLATSLSLVPANAHKFAGFVQASHLFRQTADLCRQTLVHL